MPHQTQTLRPAEMREGAGPASTPNWQVQVTRLTKGSLILLSLLGRLTEITATTWRSLCPGG